MQANEPRPQMTSASLLLSIAAIVYLLVLAFRAAPPLAMVWAWGSFVLFALPGVLVGMGTFGWDVRRHPESLLFGAMIGIGSSGYIALVIGHLYHWSVGLTVVGVVLLTIVALLFALRFRQQPLVTLRPWTGDDYTVLGAMALVVLAFVTIPLLHVGAKTPDGYAYTWLFGFDFISRGSNIVSILIGLPIEQIHMAGVPLSMYLVSYALPAFAYSAAGPAVRLHEVMILLQLLLDLFLAGCLLSFWRLFAKSKRALLGTAAIALLAYSYYWVVAVARWMAPYLPPHWGTALDSHLPYGEVSHLLQRLFLVEPQAVTALSVFLFVLTITLAAGKRPPLTIVAMIGIFAGIEFGIDSWLALTLAAWFAGVQFLRMGRNWLDRQLWRDSVITGSICVALWLSFFAIRMVSFRSGSMISVAPYWWGLKFGVLQYGIEYGPMLIVGIAALWWWRKRDSSAAWPMLLLVGLAIFQDLSVHVAQLPRFRMGNRLLPIALLAAIAWLLENRETIRPRWRLALVTVAVLAVPTFLTDLRGTSNVGDRGRTYYVRVEDREACDWIRHNLPQSAIVQSAPNYSGHRDPLPAGGPPELSLIPDFGERRSILGEDFVAASICPGCQAIMQARRKDLKTMFQAKDPATVESIVGKYGIDYLYLGPFELKGYPKFVDTLRQAPAMFGEMYAHDGVYIFRTSGPTAISKPQ